MKWNSSVGLKSKDQGVRIGRQIAAVRNDDLKSKQSLFILLISVSFSAKQHIAAIFKAYYNRFRDAKMS